jgi:hypothetical protein
MIRHRLTVVTFVVSTMLTSMSCLSKADDIAGRVVDTSGKPICPSCYADCGKHATTDAEGNFTIQNLDPSLTFHLVAAAEGHRARNSGRIDPMHDKASFRLAPLPTDLDPRQTVRGRIVDQDGKPVVGALVSPVGCKQGERRWGGSLAGVDAFSITNQRGEFLITASDPADAFDLEVKSPRHAAKRFALVETGSDVHKLEVEIGSFVRGTLLADGQPVADALLGLVQTDRSGDVFFGEQQIGTRSDGSFEFSYVPAEADYYLYTKMSSSAADAGSLPLRRVSIGDSESTIELGELEVRPSHTLAGRLELTDGKPVPGPLQLMIDREGAWDAQTAIVERDGKFRFENVPDSEAVTFSARVPGYRLSGDRNYHQVLNDTSLAMFVEGSRDDLVIYFEPTDDAKK